MYAAFSYLFLRFSIFISIATKRLSKYPKSLSVTCLPNVNRVVARWTFILFSGPPTSTREGKFYSHKCLNAFFLWNSWNFPPDISSLICVFESPHVKFKKSTEAPWSARDKTAEKLSIFLRRRALINRFSGTYIKRKVVFGFCGFHLAGKKRGKKCWKIGEVRSFGDSWAFQFPRCREKSTAEKYARWEISLTRQLCK